MYWGHLPIFMILLCNIKRSAINLQSTYLARLTNSISSQAKLTNCPRHTWHAEHHQLLQQYCIGSVLLRWADIALDYRKHNRDETRDIGWQQHRTECWLGWLPVTNVPGPARVWAMLILATSLIGWCRMYWQAGHGRFCLTHFQGKIMLSQLHYIYQTNPSADVI